MTGGSISNTTTSSLSSITSSLSQVCTRIVSSYPWLAGPLVRVKVHVSSAGPSLSGASQSSPAGGLESVLQGVKDVQMM